MLNGAHRDVMFTTVFKQISPKVLAALKGKPNDPILRVGLQNTATSIIGYHKDRTAVFVAPAMLDEGIEGWLREHKVPGHKGNIFVHTKMILIDFTTDTPTVISGSHNFTAPASHDNDENYLILKSKKGGEIAGDNPWDAPTLEWSIPSPPPEYNFAQIPMVTSRYPLWDLTHPERTAEIPHSATGWEEAKRQTGEHETVSGGHFADMAPAHIETEVKTAKELGISMPTPTIKPLFVALGMGVMMTSLLPFYAGKISAFVVLLVIGAGTMIFSLYDWLLTPLEEEH